METSEEGCSRFEAGAVAAGPFVCDELPARKERQEYYRVGCSNCSATADIYARLSPGALDTSAACMENLLIPKVAEGDGKEVIPMDEKCT